MERLRYFVLVLAALQSLVRYAYALGASDTITWGGDVSRAGYETNHNMDPAVVRGADFGQIWRAQLPGNFNGIGPEQIFSQPLVYTLADGIQYVFVATTQNNVYKINAKTGAIVSSRDLHVPFLTADLDGCVDINPTIGVTATGVIDPATGYWYFTAKTYSAPFQNGQFTPQSPPGRLNGRYYFHAIDTKDLSEVAGFPIALEGTVFRNNPARMLISGNQHQRPGLLQVGDYIYTGWASHCVQYNFTGAIIGVHRTTGAVVEAFATEGGPEPNSVPGGGVWMSGGGLAYDGKGSMFFATGNGYASQLPAAGHSVQGRNPPTSLEEAVVNMKISEDGKLTPVDFMMPWEKTQLDGADKDLGTSPLQILPSDTFTCPNHRRIGVVTGKSGKTYWLNLDNLGGYQMGPNKLDAVIQVYQNENSVYAGAGVVPLGGGYVMINVIQYKTHIFKFSCDSSGDAAFTKVADTTNKNAYILGVSHGATTSLSGREGTGLFWQTDVEGQNLRIYNAIPPTDGGDLVQINGFNIPGVTKFSRPVFGDGRAYVGTTLGHLYAFGSLVNLPINCSAPNVFPQTPIGNVSASLTVTCTALTQTTVNNLNLTGNANFRLSALPTIPLQLAAGASFSFQAAFAPKSVGILSSDVVVSVSNAAAGFSGSVPVTLTGTSNSAAPLLAINPITVSFTSIVGQGTSKQTIIFSNTGDSLLTMKNISYSTVSEKGPWLAPNVTTDGIVQVGSFNFTGIPTTIAGNSQLTVTVAYSPVVAGNDAVYFTAFSDGGSKIVNVVGTGASQPSALFEFQSADGKSWIPYNPSANFSFGNVLQSTTKSLLFRVTNNGSATAASLSLTASKPPFGVPGIVGTANSIDLAEGTVIAANTSQTATLFCAVPERQPNTPSYRGSATWTINTNDPTLGKKIFSFDCNAASEQVGVLFANGTAQYPYLGCYQDNTPGRQLATQTLEDDSMTNGRCITSCQAAGWKYAGTQYTRQCWCGNALPLQIGTELDCNYRCNSGNGTCGGNGVLHDRAMLSLFVDATKFDGTRISPPVSIPKSAGLYQYKGCYKETTAKSFSQKSTGTNSMTVESCQAFCNGYTMMGLEYAGECWCGTTLDPSVTLASDADCNMNCKGNNSQYCGAGNRMQVYQFGPLPSSTTTSILATTSSALASTATVITTTGSTTASVLPSVSSTTAVTTTPLSSTALSLTSTASPVIQAPSSTATPVSTTLSTITSSITTIMTTSVVVASSSIAATSASATSVSTTAVIMSSSVPSTTSLLTTAAPTSSETPSTTIVAPSSTTSSPSPPTVGPYIYIGCYTEVDGRALKSKARSGSNMTNQVCASFCAGTMWMATQYSSECYCGDTLSDGSARATDGRCNMKCANDTSQICGGPNGLTLYRFNSTASPTTASPTTKAVTPIPTVVPTVSGYVSQGCYSEKPGGRALQAVYANSSSMSVPMCAGKASQGRYKWFGVEYGSECWMGNSLDAAATPLPQSKCGFLCPGDQVTYCGAGNSLQLYNTTAFLS